MFSMNLFFVYSYLSNRNFINF